MPPPLEKGDIPKGSPAGKKKKRGCPKHRAQSGKSILRSGPKLPASKGKSNPRMKGSLALGAPGWRAVGLKGRASEKD